MSQTDRSTRKSAWLIPAVVTLTLLGSASAGWCGPLQVKMTGVLVPSPGPEAPNTYTLRYHGREWLLQVTEIDSPTLYNGANPVSSILNEVGPPVLQLRAEKETVQPLETKDAACKVFQFQGLLYVSSGTLLLDSLEPVGGQETASAPPYCG
jgi:hypothetical protein